MKDFITALQFLTRIHILRQEEVTAAEFGRSVRYFPLVGAVIGAILASWAFLTLGYLPIHVLAASLIILELVLTGGLHGDGFMDTMDGVFSGRSRERMLEIMKDSRVGANGVMAFCALILLKWSLILDLLLTGTGTVAFFVMPLLGRLAIVIAVTAFPYARPEGIGKAFAQFAGRPSLYFAVVLSIVLVLPFGKTAGTIMVLAVVVTLVLCRYFVKRLGGLTGDVYGAVNELVEIAVLILFLSKEWLLLWVR
ncbi:MAG: Cobalamin synthase [Firmicutes bacterium]|nr:Cobalamin synthase [Bacillota bacterium]